MEDRGPGDRIESPYDVDARFRSKAGTSWTGYMVHLTETCDERTPHLVLHANTTPTKGLARAEHLVDSVYVSAEHLIRARERYGIDLVGPVQPRTGWQNSTEGAFGSTDFAVDWERCVVRCPESHDGRCASRQAASGMSERSA